MDSDKQKEFAHKFLLNAYQEGKIDILDEILHPEYAPNEAVEFLQQFDKMDLGSGIAKVKHRMLEVRKGVSDLTFDIVETVAEGDRVIVYYKFKAKHVDMYLGIPGTGKYFSTIGFHLFTFKEGKIYRVALIQDHYKVLRDIGRAVLDTEEEKQIQMYLEALKNLRITR
ncbi:MAG: ester cyclase [Candidatus Heimdallarchaeota archaeon]|nr:ester cyclase [Candidatus Heimdallarchaeota archaeon]